jgi:hypothetical protein
LCIGRVGGLAIALGPVEPSLNIDVSYNGMDLLHMGDATANSGTGDLAIAYGDGATADAGYGSTSSGLSLVGQHDSAFADGSGSTAISGAGDYDSATASNGAIAYSGLFIGNGVQATGGSDDIASASGAGSTALAGGFNSVTDTAGSNDIAEAFGNDLTANASTGSNLFDFEPSVFTAAAADAPADDYGLSALGLEAFAPGLDSLLGLF